MLQALLPEVVERVMVPGAGWLLTYLFHSTALLGLAWALDRWSRVAADARLRSWLWRTALVGGVVTTTVASLGWSPSAVELSVTEAEKAVLELPAAGQGAAARPTSADPTPSPAEASSRLTSGAPVAARFTRPHRSDLTDPAAWWTSVGHDWPHLLVLGSVAVAALVLAGRATRLWSFFRRLRGRKTVESGPLCDALDDLERGDRGDRTVSLSTARGLASPVALPGGEICVPARVPGELDEGEMKALLAHELAHLRRGDPSTLLGLATLEALLAIQPLNRVARRRLVAATECQIDDRVRSLGLGTELASTLVTVGRWMRGRRAQGPAAGLAREGELEARVRRLLDGPDVSAKTSGRAGASMIAGGAAVLGVVTLLSPAASFTTAPHSPHLGHGSADTGRGTIYCDSPFATASDRGGEDCSPETGPPATARRELADGSGVGLYVEVDAPQRQLRLRFRPGGASLRWFSSSGRQMVLPLPPSGEQRRGEVATLGVSAREAGEQVLYLPPSVRRLMVVVNGRVVTRGRLPRGGGFPRLVAPKEGETTASS